MDFRFGQVAKVLLGIGFFLFLGSCGSTGDSESKGPVEHSPDSLVFLSPSVQYWGELKELDDSFVLLIADDSLLLWWSADTLQFQSTSLFVNAEVAIQYFNGTTFVPIKTVNLEVPRDNLVMNVSANAEYNFQIIVKLSDNRSIFFLPDSGLRLVSLVPLGADLPFSSSSVFLNSSSSSSNEDVSFEIQTGVWGGYFDKVDTTVTMVLQLNADNSFVQTMTYNWNQPTQGCRKVEYKGTWRQDLWILTLDRSTVAEYQACIHEWIGPPQSITEDPIAFSIQFMDDQALDILVQWPEANDWFQLSQ